jgi:hypothetical protein
VDVDPVTFNLDIADLEKRVALLKKEGRLKPRAVIGVDLFGLPADCVLRRGSSVARGPGNDGSIPRFA